MVESPDGSGHCTEKIGAVLPHWGSTVVADVVGAKISAAF